MSTYLILNILYSLFILGISIIYYFYEKLTVEPGKLKRRLSSDIFDKYLEFEDKPSQNNDKKDEEKQKLNEETPEKLSYSIQDVIDRIKIECKNFLLSEFKLIMLFSIIFSILFFFAGKESIAIYFVISFLIGIIVSLVCVYYATTIAVSNCEIVLNQSKLGIEEAFKINVDCSARMSVLMMTISYFSFFFTSLFLKYLINSSNEETFEILCGYGFGCTYSALFCRIGGGIFTKGADISCDVVGKMERNLSENDYRNPASIADNVGDLIGDLAGSILDLVASIAETFCAVTLIISFMNDTEERNFEYIITFFTLFSTCQLVFIIVEYYMSHFANNDVISDKDIEGYLFSLIQMTTLGMIIATISVFYIVAPESLVFKDQIISKNVIILTILIGLCASYLICYSTYYYTGKSFQSIQHLAKLTNQSPALNVIYGLSIGFLSTLAPMIIIAISVLISDLLCGIFGIAFASFGFLLNLPIILLYQMFGPIADVSLGIVNIVKCDTSGGIVGSYINQLDITGNTMSAVVKGFASGSAGLVSFGIYGAVMLSAGINVINVYEIETVILLLLGGVFTYLIQSLCMYATADNATLLINESRKQISLLSQNPANFKPDYYECIQLSAQHAFKNATLITGLCIIINLSVGELLGFDGLVSFLSGVIIAGIPITISSSNSGSAWDNSKKIIETEDNVEAINESLLVLTDPNPEQEIDNLAAAKRKLKRKKSLKNALIGDNIGDAFKDIAGPAINILIKFSSYFSLIMVNYLLIK